MAFVHTRTRVMLARCFCLAALLAALGACASASKTPPPGAEEPDKFLYEHGSEALKDKRWFAGASLLPAARRQLSPRLSARMRSSASVTATSAKAAPMDR